MKKILAIGYVWPEPTSSAAGSHIMSILRLFKKQNWTVEFASPAQLTEHSADLKKDGISSQAINLNCDSFDEYIKIFQPDIVLFDRFMMEEQFAWRVEKNCPDALTILDTEDLQCLRFARHQALKANREMTLDDLFNDIAKREIAAILRSDIALIISSFEMDLLQNTFNVNNELLQYLPFMLDLKKCPQKTMVFSERKHFMMIGNFRHAPNWDAVLYLQEIWPQIRKKIPQAECHIYGAYMPPKASALHNSKTGFLVKGRAENAFTVMEQARVCLAPIRFGAGIKGKLLDAMIMQTPSVTTSVGSEGMCKNKCNWPGAVADNKLDFVEQAVELYWAEKNWKAAQQKATTLLASEYNADVHSKKLIEKINVTLDGLQQHRLNNFTGAMLKHHSLMSTKYMSQWIAEKIKLK